MSQNEHPGQIHSMEQAQDEALPSQEQAEKRRFVEPEVSVPTEIFEATTFFLFATTDTEGF